MYLEHYGLNEPPFRITPHTDFFFDGADRGATLEALIYAILNDEGIVKVSGEVGSGKTMLCRVLMERLPAHVDTIYLSTPSLGRDEILFAIADDLKLQFTQTRVSVALRELQEHLIGLYAAGRRVVILIDEAHAMPEDTLEQVRLLSNLESSRHKLLQIVLFGQPELDDALAKPSLRQLKDRITHSFRMRPLSESEVGMYLAFRMRAAGYRGPEVFTPKAVSLIARAASGLTRRINILADKSLLSAFTVDTHVVTAQHARAAIADCDFTPLGRAWRPALYATGVLAVGVFVGVIAHSLISGATREPMPGKSAAAGLPPSPAPNTQLLPAARPQSMPAAASQPAVNKKPKSRPVAKAQQDTALSPQVTAGSELKADAEPEPEPVASPPPSIAPPSYLSEAQLQRMQRYSGGGQPLLTKRLAATREFLGRAPGDAYALEFYVTENIDQARVERFLMRARDLLPLEQLYIIPLFNDTPERLWVMFGNYPSQQAAQLARKDLPLKYQRNYKMVPRSFAAIRHAI
jgi:MSHA biogenesis protein MshM